MTLPSPRLSAEVLLALLLAGWIGWLMWSKDRLRADLRAERATAQRLQAEQRQLRASAERQNEAIAALRAEADSLQRRVRQASAQAASIRRQAERDAGAVMAAPVPDSCEAAAAWARNHAHNLAHEWTN